MSCLLLCVGAAFSGEDKLPRHLARWTTLSLADVEKAAVAGNASAQYFLGWNYYHGHDVSVDHEAGLKWLQSAADLGVADAQLKLGLIEELGLGRPANLLRAVERYEQAARGGNVVAQHKTWQLYSWLTSISNHNEKANTWLQVSAEQGYGPSVAAWQMRRKKPVPDAPFTNSIIAEKWVSAHDDNALSQFQLAQSFQGHDQAESYKWLLLANEHGSSTFQAYLKKNQPLYTPEEQAAGKRRAEQFERDFPLIQGIALLEEAANQGIADAQYQMGWLLMSDNAKRRDPTTAYKWLLLAARQKHYVARLLLRSKADSYTEEQQSSGRKMAASFQPKPVSAAWRHSESLLSFFPVDEIQGGTVINRLEGEASAGSADAQFKLGLFNQHQTIHFLRELPSPEDLAQVPDPNLKSRHERAVKWYEGAISRGHPDAPMYLAGLYMNRPAQEQNQSEMQRLLELAATKRTEARYQLAGFLERKGNAPLADVLKYYLLAAENGHHRAKERIEALRGSTKSGAGMVTNALVSASTIKPVPPAGSMTRLGILFQDARLKDAADVLTATLSQEPGVVLLERAQLDKVFAEQALAQYSQRDLLKMGQLLSADGLVWLEAAPAPATNRFFIRTIAVKPGVIVSEHTYPLPLNDLSEWSQIAARQLGNSLAKMRVSVTDAIPLSVLNLRAALTAPGYREKEAQLTWLLTRQLVLQPELFVLERTKLEKLTKETQLGTNETAFWSGSYTLEGVIDGDQVEAGLTVIDIRLVSPKTEPKKFRVTGASTNLPSLVEQITTNIMAALAIRRQQSVTLNPLEEAAAYYDEAKWALRWGLYTEAQQASEASWALGLRRPDLNLLRIKSYMTPGILHWLSIRHDPDGPIPPPPVNQEGLNNILRACEVMLADLRLHPTGSALDPQVMDIAEGVLLHASQILWRNGSSTKDLPEQGEALAQMRQYALEIADLLGATPDGWKVQPRNCLARMTLNYAGVWEKDFAGTKKRLEALIDRGIFNEIIANPQYGYDDRICPFSWQPGEKAKAPQLFARWIDGLMRENGHLRPLVPFYYRVGSSTGDYEFEDYFLPLIAFLEKNRPALVADQISLAPWEKAAEHLRRNSDRSHVLTRLKREEFAQAEPWIRAALQERQEFIKHRNATPKVEALMAALQAGIKDKKENSAAWFSLAYNVELNRERAEKLALLLTEYEAKAGTQGTADLRRKINQVLAPSAAVAPPSAPVIAIPATPVIRKPKEVFHQTNLLTEIAAHMLLPDKFNPAGKQEWIMIGYEVADEHIWFELAVRHPLTRSLFKISLASLESLSVPYPQEAALPHHGPLPGKAILWHEGKLHVLSGNKVFVLDGDAKAWTDTGVEVPPESRLFSIAGRMLAVTPTSILQVDLERRNVGILASTRRRPAVNPLDSLSTWGTLQLFTGPDDMLCTQIGAKLYLYDWKSLAWAERDGLPNFMRLNYGYHNQALVFLEQSQYLTALNLKEFRSEVLVHLIGENSTPSMGFGRPKGRWDFPKEMYGSLRGTGFHVGPGTLHWRPDSLWMLLAFSHWPFTSSAREDRFEQVQAETPYLMVYHSFDKKPVIFPLQLPAPKGWPGTSQYKITMVAGFDSTSVLTDKHLVLISAETGVIWVLPKRQLDPYFQSQSRSAGDVSAKRFKQLEQRAAQWRVMHDADQDGKLSAMEMRSMTNNPKYKENAAELEALESKMKGKK
jgi:TPR repeat protein